MLRKHKSKLDEKNLEEKCKILNKKYSIKKSTSHSEYTEFTNDDEIEKWATPLYQPWASQLKKFKDSVGLAKPFRFDENHNLNNKGLILDSYSGYDFREMNEIMRKVKEEDKYTHTDFNPKYKQMCNILTYELLSAPRINKNIVLYRAVDSDVFENIMSHISDRHPIDDAYFHELGFMSTSLLKSDYAINCNEKDSKVPEGLGYRCSNYILKIFVREGTVGVHSSSSKSDIKADRFEHEILLLPGCLESRKKAYIDEDIKKIILECSYCYKHIEPYQRNQ